MQVNDILEEMKQNGDERAIKVWEQQGMDIKAYYGMNVTKLKELAKKIKKNHELALELWETGVHDARLLATFVEDPKKVTPSQINYWKGDVNFWDLADKLSQNVIAKTQFAKEIMDDWLRIEEEYTKRMGYIILTELAKDKRKKINLENYLPLIASGLNHEKNFIRDGANYALIAAGSASKELNEAALQILADTGKPVIEHYGAFEAPDAEKILKSEKVRKKFEGKV